MKNRESAMKFLAWLFGLMMIVCVLPITRVFASTKKQSFTNAQLSVIRDDQTTLAQGVTQDVYTVYDQNGKQVKMFSATIDPSVDTVKIFTSYQNMDNSTYGMSKLTEQVKAFNDKAASGDPYYHGTVVAGINASYYNMTTGKPSGVFVMNGNDVTGNEKSAYFAVLKDGTVKIGTADDYATDKGNIREAIGIYKMLLNDGNIVLSEADQKSDQKYPRQTIGITADNKVVILSADGNQEPISAGLTLMEQAQVMLDLGCKWAGHLDGGGSMTYGSKPAGEDNFVIVNKPSDGSERSISNGLLIVSTAVVSKTFSYAEFDVETEYATVGTPVAVSAVGVSTSGHSAELPEGLVYKVENGKYENGCLTASAVGDVTLTAEYNGKEVGSVTIHAVVPEKISFVSSSITVPYGKTVELDVVATYGVNEVKIKAEDLLFTLEKEEIGVINGFDFTAGDGSVSESVITVTVNGTSVSATAKIVLGKGSEVVFDFEDGDTSMFKLGYVKFNYTLPEGKVYPVTAETGKVHSGNGAMALDINYGNSLESGYMMTALQYAGDEKTFENAKTLGMWLYISDEDVSTWIRYTVYPLTLSEDGTYQKGSDLITTTRMDDKNSGTGVVNTFEEPGWHYLSIDLSKYAGLYLHQGYIVQFYISDRDGAEFNYYYNEHKSYNGRYVIYVDDVTVDYSDAVEDREAPIFGDVTYATANMSDSVTLNGQTVDNNVLSFGVKVADNTTKNNYTGLNAATAKAYIDGVETACEYKNGIMSVSDVVLADGVHHVKFSICDNQGNYASVIRKINVAANSGRSTVKVVAHDPSLDKILLGSVWYADIVATDIEKVKSVTVDIDLNNMSKWELAHMIVATGFKASYSIQDDENIATITISRVGTNNSTGEGILASLPIRTWELKMGYTYESGTKKGSAAYTYAQFKSMKEFWPIDISMEIDRGIVTFTDGTSDTFSGEGPQVDTEMYKMAKDMISTAEGKAYYDAWNGGHIHTAESVADKAATCTEEGYTGRTYCEVCKSIVEWGKKVPAKGHTYELKNDVLACSDCGDLYNGVWTDDREYIDGVVIGDGWHDDKYYVDGKKVTGVYAVDDIYYDFGEDGQNQGKYTGRFCKSDKWYFANGGILTSGWVQFGDDWYLFREDTKAAATGEYTYNGVKFTFNDEGMTKGAWYSYERGKKYFYGPYYYRAQNPDYMTLITIDGKTYNFDEHGYATCGIRALRDGTTAIKYVFDFGQDGALIKTFSESGFVTAYDGSIYFIGENGYVEMDKHLIKVGNDYYYVCWSGKLLTSGGKVIGKSQANGYPFIGWYDFDKDGKVIKTGITFIDGDYFYRKDYEIQKDLGLVEVEGSYYFVSKNGKLLTDTTITLNEQQTNGLLAVGEYTFGSDGKITSVINGIVQIGDDSYYKIDGAIQKDLGLIKVGDDYYFVCWSGKLLKNATRVLGRSQTNGLLAVGEYTFGSDGRVTSVVNGVVKIDDVYYYKKDGAIQKDLGLIKVDDDYYFVCWSGKLLSNTTRYLGKSQTNGLLEAGEYTFGVDGKITSVINGIVQVGENNYYKKDGAIQKDLGLIKVGDDYYFVCWSGKLLSNTTRYLGKSQTNGLLEAGEYTFGSDGKITTVINGIVKIGNDYYYKKDGAIQKDLGLIKVGDDYYFVCWSGKLAVNSERVIGKSQANGYPFVGARKFGADGKMVQD